MLKALLRSDPVVLLSAIWKQGNCFAAMILKINSPQRMRILFPVSWRSLRWLDSTLLEDEEFRTSRRAKMALRC
jgi:hypothetical protein